MVTVKKNNSRPSHSGAGTSRSGGGGGNHIFKTKNMSYYSNSTSESQTPKNYRIFAFANRGGPLHRMGTTRCEDIDDQDVTENMTIVNHLKKLVKEGGDQKKKRKRKNHEKEKEVDEFEGLYVIDEKDEKIDLKVVASSGDEVFESVLKEKTNGMATEYQLLGVLYSLDGTWGSDRKRTKYVDAAVFAKVLPANWRILVSLRPRATQPSLYCHRFVSPSGVHLKLCKEVAFYLKSQLLTSHTSPPGELAMMQIENDSQVDVNSGALVLRSSSPDSKFPLLNVNRKKISLRLLGSNGDNEFQSVLNTMTDGMVEEDEILGVMNTLDGTWGSNRKRRKYVDAAVLVKILPVNWKILLSLRPRARQPSLYCRRFVSPSGVHFNSCKDVAFYLKSQFVTTDTSPPEEVAMMQIKEKSVVRKTVSNKEVDHLDDTAMSLDKPIDFPINEEGSSSFPKPLTDPKKSSEAKGKLKTRCMWCLVAFFLEHADAETLVGSSGFICPKCKVDAAWRFDNALSELTQDVGK